MFMTVKTGVEMYMYSVSVTRVTDLLLVADDVRIINAEGNKLSAEQLDFFFGSTKTTELWKVAAPHVSKYFNKNHVFTAVLNCDSSRANLFQI